MGASVGDATGEEVAATGAAVVGESVGRNVGGAGTHAYFFPCELSEQTKPEQQR